MVRIGTSGWHYPHWRGPFYPDKLPASRMLAYYLEHFDTVELNNSFYRLPSEAAFQDWHDSTPANFRFAVKASRFITHMKKLKDPQAALARFLPRAELLGRKLGPILFQLPPWWELNLERLLAFLEVLPRGHRYCFELRNPTWHVPEVYRALRKHNAAFCIYEIAGFQSGKDLTADFSYIRLHGPGGAYQGSYSDATLSEWAARIRNWSRDLKQIYVYFDNDQGAFAARNALRLKELL
jgi:uncharacterized protein YecE (DUF72 family)